MTQASSSPSLCLIIGDPVAHSLSPKMHNAAYREMNINYVMGAARVTEGSLPDALRGVRALNIRGLACTMPHKVSICPLLDGLDPVARAIGAVNTVVRENDKLIGFNTDWLGILRPLESKISLRDKRVAVLGAGGAALAAVYACISAEATVTIFNRTISKAIPLAKRFDIEVAPLSDSCDLARFDVIINTTSVGMSPNTSESPLTATQIRSHHVIFETIYYPHQTQLLRLATSNGATVLRGLDMFLEQGAAQFELHTGVKAPRETMRNEISPPLVTYRSI